MTDPHNKNRLESAEDQNGGKFTVGANVWVDLGSGFVGKVVDIMKTSNYGGNVKVKVQSPTRKSPFYVSIALVTKTRRRFKDAKQKL